MAAKKTKATTKKKTISKTIQASASKPVATQKVAKAASKPKSRAKAVESTPAAPKPAAPKPAARAAQSKPAPKAAAPKAAAPKHAVASEPAKLGVGDAVPAFEALDQAGQTVSSSSLVGAPYVIYFYPKDDTPGCTTEACGFRDELAVFAEQGVKVLGVSPDSSASHARFAQKYGLGFTLLADTDKQLAGLFGVWKLKQNYGREYWGVERSTFVVDAEGKIRKQWRGVKVAGHVPAVLQAVAEL